MADAEETPAAGALGQQGWSAGPSQGAGALQHPRRGHPADEAMDGQKAEEDGRERRWRRD